jgi:hypothetical protein
MLKKKKIGGKKNIVVVGLLGVRCGPLSRALPCPIFSQIFSVFGNKDSAFFIKIADFALMEPAALLAAVAQLYAATGVKTLGVKAAAP